jgi:hypothetical protein
MVFDGGTYPTPGSLFARGWKRPPSKGFIRINKIKENIIYFFSLCVNYNNRSPAVGNDNQNGINCHRRATILYELTNKDIVTNNIAAQLYFKLTLTWSFHYIYARHKSMTEKNAPALLAISMAMQIRWYGAKRIAQYSKSRATLDFRCHWTPLSGKYSSHISPADTMVIDFGVKNRVVAL